MAFNNYSNRSQQMTPVVLNLILLNVAVFLAQTVLDSSLGITGKFALYPFNSGFFKPYQLVTHMFTHGGISHILFNMISLWIFGTALERVWGPKRFLIFYLACGLAAGISQLFLSDAPAVGASGAIMGLLAGFAYLFPNTEFYILPLPFPVKAKYMAAFYAVYDLFSGIHPGAMDNIAHFAHLGGLVMGFILVIIWNKTNRKTFY